MAFVEGDRVAGHKAAHDLAEWRKTCAQQEMEVVWNERPGVALGLGFLKDHSKSFQKGLAVLVVPKDFSAFDPSGHYVLKDTRGIKSCLAWHRFFCWTIQRRAGRINWILQPRLNGQHSLDLTG